MFADSIEEIYSHPELLDFYTKLVGCGLYPWENALLNQICARTANGSALIVGCGAGRETFVLSEHFRNTLGIDITSVMVARALSFSQTMHSKAQFSHQSLEDLSVQQKFDVIWISIGLTNHIESRENRIAFLKKASAHLNCDGVIAYFPDIHSASPDQRREFGGKRDLGKSYFYRCYISVAQVESEILDAGLYILRSSLDGFLLSL